MSSASSSTGTNYRIDWSRGVVIMPDGEELPLSSGSTSGINSRSEWIDSVTWYLIDAYVSGAQMPGPADFWADVNFVKLFGQLPDKRLRGAGRGNVQISSADFEIFKQVAAWLWDQGVAGNIDFSVWRGIPRPDPSLPENPPPNLGGVIDDIVRAIIEGENAARVAEINARAQVDAAKIYAGAQVEAAKIGAEAQIRSAEIHAAATIRAAEIHAAAERYRTEMEWAARVMEEDGRNKRFNLELAEQRRQFNLALLKDYYVTGVELAKRPVDWIGYQYYLQNMGLPVTLSNLVTAANMFGAIPPSGPSIYGPIVGGPAILDGYADIAIYVAGASGPDDPALFPDIATATVLNPGVAETNGGYGGWQIFWEVNAAATAQGQTLADVQGQISQGLVSGAGVPDDVVRDQQQAMRMLVSIYGADAEAIIRALGPLRNKVMAEGASGAQAVNAVRESLQQQAQTMLSQIPMGQGLTKEQMDRLQAAADEYPTRPLPTRFTEMPDTRLPARASEVWGMAQRQAAAPQGGPAGQDYGRPLPTRFTEMGITREPTGTAQGQTTPGFPSFNPLRPTESQGAPWQQWMNPSVITQPGTGPAAQMPLLPVPPAGTNPFYAFLQYTAQQLGIPQEQMAQIAGLQFMTPYYGDLSQVLPQTPVFQALSQGTPLNRFRTANPQGEKFATAQAAGVPLGIRSGQDINLGEYLKALPSQQEMIQGLVESSGQYFPDTLAQMMRSSPLNPDVMPGIPGVRRR